MSKSPTILHYFYFPDPFGTGESAAIEAESQEEALQKIELQRPQPVVVEVIPEPQHTDAQPEATERQDH